ncbi:thioesterase domain-containing protein [Kitasatospora sp. NPDC058046]|uniref:thioesterase domain-containing protein n=1 Tax=Kitasatospora sp. NPDC058046 TaxID=3346312 RepID=UPI0036DD5D50
MDSAHDRVHALSPDRQEALRRLLADQGAGLSLLDIAGSSLKPLRRGTDDNLFVFPATEGGVGYMSGYLPQIPPRWSVYGCQSPGLDGEQQPLTTVEEIAAHDIQQIRLVQPHGPYRLVGNCMGGLPAFEAACQLQADGERVDLLLHLMPAFDRPWRTLPAAEAPQLRGLLDYGFIIGRFLGREVPLPLDEISAAPPGERAAVVARFLSRQEGLTDSGFDVLLHRITIYQANLTAMLAYRPQGTFTGTLHLLTVGSTARGETHLSLEAPYASALRAVTPAQIHNTHIDAEATALFDCAEPHIGAIGRGMREVLSKLDPATATA